MKKKGNSTDFEGIKDEVVLARHKNSLIGLSTMISGLRKLTIALTVVITIFGVYFMFNGADFYNHFHHLPEKKAEQTVVHYKIKPRKRIVYNSPKPNGCRLQVNRIHCLQNLQNQIGFKQCRNPACSCFPLEIFEKQTPSTLLGTFPPITEPMLPIEKELQDVEPLMDIEETSSATLSNLVLLDSSKIVNVGDIINVRVDAKDGARRQRTVGADFVQVWMRSVNGPKQASSAEVVDLKNGSYIATLRALWEGDSIIVGALPFTREENAFYIQMGREYRSFNFYVGQFRKEELEEFTLCSVFSVIPGYNLPCNFTEINYGFEWYCGKPVNVNLTCNDFVFAKDYDFVNIPLTLALYNTFVRSNRKIMIPSRIKLKIESGRTSQPQTNRIDCTELPRRETWNMIQPTGYFNGNKWENIKCHNPVNKLNFLSCFKDTTLIVFGDSTIRQYFSYIRSAFNCYQTTPTWTKLEWHQVSHCHVPQYNFSLTWAVQELPFTESFKASDGKINLKPAAVLLNEIPSSGRIVFLIHYYVHFIRQHYSLFIDRIRSLKTPIRNALKRNKEIHIAIKSPHVFYVSICPTQFSIFQGKLYMDILKRELAEFHDKVWFLNIWDMSTASENYDIHPPAEFVWENLRLLAGHVCNK
ncbi:hypothetical protein LOTGIDRAFT_172517 [Lottia gigantea]|uniref:NXPE C-terminal domain-containing protein n=1 Tax=Lottia gigantea TaxID=225164 RepID=V4AW53_LOTGI|nr:hypothetical protein LOTGIDRAFT_172517 [Lottia gigantea]ESP01668.1 hypothetical protein LOTGIDRAFT_172517 [Lottia gigantea]